MADVKKKPRTAWAGREKNRAVSFRLTEAEIRILDAAAQRAGGGRSRLIRRGAIAAAERILAEGAPSNGKGKNR